jgi:hypothetical protein
VPRAEHRHGEDLRGAPSAVDGARKGDRLTVRGICRGTTVIDRNVVIEGIRTEDSGKPTLSGASSETIGRRRSGRDSNCGAENGQRVRVVEITTSARVTLRDLFITRGLAVRGAGIRNRGDLTLRDVQVRGNILDPHGFTGWGAGVYNEGRLRLNGGTRIAHNQGTCDTRYEVLNRDTIVMNGSSSIGSLGNMRHATLTMNGTSSLRGGIDGQLGNAGRVTMNDASWVRPEDRGRGQDGYHSGAGVYNGGTFTMNDASSIRDGRRPARGASNYGTFTMNDESSISGNPRGGLCNYRNGVVRMKDASSIHDNTGFCFGGGVLMVGGRLRLTGSSSITANAAIERTDEYACVLDGVHGGGIYHSGGHLVGVTCGPGGNVTGNTPDDCYFEP